MQPALSIILLAAAPVTPGTAASAARSDAAPPPRPAAVATVAARALLTAGSADSIAWVYVANAAALLTRLERSPLAPLAPLFGNPDTRVKVRAQAELPALLTLLRPPAPGRIPEALLLADAGSCAALLARQIGTALAGAGCPETGTRDTGAQVHHCVARPLEVDVAVNGGRLVLATSAARAAQANEVAVRPVSASDDWLRMLERAPGADVRGRLDLQQLYGMLARGEDAANWSRLIERLGLGRARALTGIGVLGPTGAANASWKLGFANDRAEGLRDIFGPALPMVWPGAIPDRSPGFVSVSLRPARLWGLVLQLAATAAPLETAFARTQIDSIETRLGKRIGPDILGETPARWLIEVTKGQGGVALALTAPLADASAALEFLRQLVEAVNVVGRSGTVRESRVDGVAVFVLGGGRAGAVRIAIDNGALVLVLGGEQAMAERLRRPSRPDRPLASVVPASASSVLAPPLDGVAAGAGDSAAVFGAGNAGEIVALAIEGAGYAGLRDASGTIITTAKLREILGPWRASARVAADTWAGEILVAPAAR